MCTGLLSSHFPLAPHSTTSTTAGASCPTERGWVHLGSPQEAVDRQTMPQHWSRAGSSPQLTAPTWAGGHPVTFPRSPEMGRVEEGGSPCLARPGSG